MGDIIKPAPRDIADRMRSVAANLELFDAIYRENGPDYWTPEKLRHEADIIDREGLT